MSQGPLTPLDLISKRSNSRIIPIGQVRFEDNSIKMVCILWIVGSQLKYQTFVSVNRHLRNCTPIRQTIDIGLKGLMGMSRIAIEFQIVSIEGRFSRECEIMRDQRQILGIGWNPMRLPVEPTYRCFSRR